MQKRTIETCSGIVTIHENGEREFTSWDSSQMEFQAEIERRIRAQDKFRHRTQFRSRTLARAYLRAHRLKGRLYETSRGCRVEYPSR